ncbi:MAG: PTS sugar transporter subunit IIBC [Sphingobacteriales bacterium]|nr:MAG: PTS sugar transporter subunit IIBC [Sphingobacteriales bacterium]
MPHTTNFLDRKVNSYRAISVLAKHGIQIDEKEAAMILNLMYIVATTYSLLNRSPKPYILKEKSNGKIML